MTRTDPTDEVADPTRVRHPSRPTADGQPQVAEATPAPDQTEPPVGDPPRLAPGVTLSGELEDTAFAAQQWLAARDGNFVQLTALLYRALEQVDGKRSVEDIAKAISEKMQRPYTPDNARRLLQKLVPLGLVLDAQGNAAPPPEGASALRGPLSINLRMAVIPPAVANAIVKPFTLLFYPPVVAALLLVSLAGHLWLYVVHGVARGTSEIIYNPGLILAVIGAFVLSAAFHEIGHGAGLRYGGGKVRAMGVGLYLVYPVFYTDITSSYALGRGARLRADLGGFYFNLIFQLMSLGLYAATGAEFLLIIMVLLDLEMLYQLLPFVRMDGYWILADLTGVPDFFTRMGAALRGLVPGAKREQMAPLKPRARTVFIIYTIVVVPLLALLLFSAFKAFPSVVATVADSSVKLLASFEEARGQGDALTAVSSIVQIALLILQVIGLAYVLFTVMRRALTALWTWARGSTGRQGIASLGTTAALGALVLLWLPANPLAGGAPGPLYGATSAAFVPIPPTARGNLGDVVPPLAAIADTFEAPRVPTGSPVPSPSATPADSPTATPSGAPSPSNAPTANPTTVPATPMPTAAPTTVPTASPTPGAS